MSDLSEQVMDALTKLGPTSLDIAQSLQNKGVRARRGVASKCAISAYLEQQFPEVAGFYTTAEEVSVLEVGKDFTRVSDYHSTPLNIHQRAFIQEFDQGYYPDLIA